MALWFKKRVEKVTPDVPARQTGTDTSVATEEKPVELPENLAPAAPELPENSYSAALEAGAVSTPVPALRTVESKKEESHLKVTIADRSQVASPKTESVAAERPEVQRGDPRALYYQLMNGLYDVILVLDEDGHVIDCNIRSEQIFGYSPDDLWNMPIDKMVYGMNGRMFNLLRKNLGSKHHILIDARCFRSNGTSFLAEIGVSTIQLTRTGNVVFAIRNIERRKSGQEEVRRLRALLDLTPVPAFTCNTDGAFEIMNPPVLKALGIVDEMEARKKRFADVMPDMNEQFQNALAGEDVNEMRLITLPDGTAYKMELALRPIRKGQEITGVAGTMVTK